LTSKFNHDGHTRIVWQDPSLQRLADCLGHLLGVADQQVRVVAVEQRIADAAIA
jgi:hypothetical protein